MNFSPLKVSLRKFLLQFKELRAEGLAKSIFPYTALQSVQSLSRKLENLTVQDFWDVFSECNHLNHEKKHPKETSDEVLCRLKLLWKDQKMIHLKDLLVNYAVLDVV